MLAKRFEYGVRWTSVLQQLLGENFQVIEAGLNGRNTSFDETRFIRPSRNGLATLPLVLEMNYPLNLVILMLGTNDAAVDFNAAPAQTAQAMQRLIRCVKKSHFGPNFQAPEVLLIAPAPISKVDSLDFNLFYDDASIAKTHQLPKIYAELALQEHCQFLDAGPIVKVSNIDGIHIDRDSHKDLARAIERKIKEMML